MAGLIRKLKPAYDFGWQFRSVESADVVLTPLGDGLREILINHAPLSGVTTAMLEWWFQSFDRVATYRGQALPAYHLWHPRDHVRVTFKRDAEGRVAPGQPIAIQEVFGREPQFEADVRSVIHRWDRRGVGFHLDVMGHRVVELDHVFTDTSQGVDYRTRMRVGVGNGPLRRLINEVIVSRRFGPETVQAWIRHNIEEVGSLVDFLPELLEARAISGHGSARSGATPTARKGPRT